MDANEIYTLKRQDLCTGRLLYTYQLNRFLIYTLVRYSRERFDQEKRSESDVFAHQLKRPSFFG